ncbi:type IV toxin-antitoxin system AbiEi family antitoxin domain-containing protein [Aeromicrobium sp.]|uniref:type IV toxin-antitoxin system AbiEi family antitoxin domain-containing protein n=1 Tax=Aeromicrobium sp. TaxID=1871063 RepID=UPI0030BF71B1
MDDLIPVAELNGGYLMRHQLNDLGYSDALIRRAMRAGVLHRARHGTYVVKQVWDVISEAQRHAILTRSLLDKLGSSVVATHQSAAALHGFDLYEADLTHVHLTRLDGHNGRKEAGVIFHEGKVDGDVVEVGGRLVIEPLRAVFEACSQASIESGMVLASSAMRKGQVTKEELEDQGDRFAHWPRTRTARLAIRLSDPRLESVGEVRSLSMMWRYGVPYPELQWRVVSSAGIVVARTDFAWLEARHTGEFDGLFKYGRLNPYSDEPGRAITHEKTREDLVRDELLGMSRWVWAELAPKAQPRTAARITQAIQRSRKLYARNATTIV